MEEEGSSWIRRAKYSHTVCHRLDSSRLASLSLSPRTNRASPAPTTPTKTHRSNLPNTQRAISPHPEVKLSDTFKEARSSQKRFSTPHPRRRDDHNHRSKSPPTVKNHGSKSPRSTSPLRHFTSMKFGKSKESTWSKYFDHGGGRVTSVESADEHIVDLSKLFLGTKFAQGAHSQLYHGIYKDEPVAVKIIRVPDDDESGALSARLQNQFTREIILLSRFNHPNVVKFIGECRKPPVYCIITEYLPAGSLRSYLRKLYPGKPLPLEKLISMALDIARGMEYIHSQGVIHRDLKPENILITEDFHLKVADFGIACEVAYCDLLADDPGTYRWMAPEMIKRKHYGKKVDVYGFGLILWEFVAGTMPYVDMTPIQAAFAVVSKNLRPTVPEDCPLAMKALIEQCWSLQPDKRPEFWQIVKVLEEFESSLARDGTLNLVQSPTCQDHRKGLLHWIQKLGPTHQSTSSMPKPKFT